MKSDHAQARAPSLADIDEPTRTRAAQTTWAPLARGQ